jgi:hypothetical protein
VCLATCRTEECQLLHTNLITGLCSERG